VRHLPLACACLLAVACGAAAHTSPRTLTASPTSSATPEDNPCARAGQVLCALNPQVTQETIGRTICVPGWTSTVRPPTSFTDRLKREQMQARGLEGPPSAWEEDHRMPLALGGAPTEVWNLSPEQPAGPNPKDRDEDSLHRLVCGRELTLAAARAQLASKWLGPYPEYRR
jgi:hypothetical protein